MSIPSPTGPLVTAGRTLSLLGVNLTIKASSADTGGVLTLIDYVAPPRFAGAQPHFHKVLTETFLVLDGTVTFILDRETTEAGPGACVIVPPRVVHGFRNATDRPAKFMVILNPGGMERYFEELIALAEAEGKWPLSDMSKVVELARRYDTFPPSEL